MLSFFPVCQVERAKMAETSCPICESRQLKLYLDDGEETLDAASFGSSRKPIRHGRVLRCLVCGFGFRQLRSSPAELAELYRRMDTTVYESERSGRAKTSSLHLKIVQRYVKPGRIIDIGCASGAFLELAQTAGWQVVGLEPSATLYEQAQTLLQGRGEILCKTLEQANIGKSCFDVVTLWDVLEHIPNPVTFLQRCESLLKPGGHLFLNVPNLESKEARLLRSRWPLLLAEHLNYFTPKSLQICGDQANVQWIRFGQRPSFFSIDYVLYRLSQHGIPGATLGRRLASHRLGQLTVPIYLGEICAIGRCRR
jgi:SAM-dependent methyltransferase